MLLLDQFSKRNIVVGYSISNLPTYHHGPSGTVLSTVPYGAFDDMFLKQLTRREVHYGPIDLFEVCGHAPTAGGTTRIDAQAPRQKVYPGFARAERLRHLASTYYELFDDWQFTTAALNVDAVQGQHPVYHFNARGSALGGIRPSNFIRGIASDSYISTNTPSFNFWLSQDPTQYVNIYYQPSYPSFPTCMLHDTWSQLVREAEDGVYDRPSDSYSVNSYRDFSLIGSGRYVDSISYLIRSHISYPPHVRDWEFDRTYRCKVSFVPLPKGLSLPIGVPKSLYQCFGIKTVVEYTCVESLFSDPVLTDGRWVDTSTYFSESENDTWASKSYFEFEDWTYFAALADGTQDTFLAGVGAHYTGSGIAVFDSTAKDLTYSNFNRVASELGPDLSSATYFSSKAALDILFPAISENHLETISGYDDLLTLVDPDAYVGLLKKYAPLVFNQARQKGSRLPLIRQLDLILKLLTSATLVYKFALAPTWDDAQKISLAAQHLRSALDLTPREAVGTFSFDVPPEYTEPFCDVKLYVVTKLWMRISPASLMAYLMPARALGLSPELSKIWALMPFSFAADWLWPTGSHIEAGEDALKLVGAEILSRTSHSVRLSWDFPPDFQEKHGFTCRSSRSGYQFYARFNSSNPPIITPTRLPFFGEPHIPDWSVAGSLVYQILL